MERGHDGVVLLVVVQLALLLPFAFLFFRGSRIRKEKYSQDVSDSDPNQKQEVASQQTNGANSKSDAFLPLNNSEGDSTLRRPANKEAAESEFEQLTEKGKSSNWRCACDGGFLPPGMFGNVEAVLRMGSGQCYHKQ